MGYPEQLSALDLAQLRKHAGRELYAAICITQRCFKGVRFHFPRTQAKAQHLARPITVYEIENVEGFLIGLEACREKFFELGTQVTLPTITTAARKQTPIGGRLVTLVGHYCQRTKQIIPVEAKHAAA